MKRSKSFAALFLAIGALCATAAPAQGQITSAPSGNSAPEGKVTKAGFEVLHMMRTGIQVRSLVRPLEIHTFTYSDQIRTEMQNLFDHGGYKYGDKVEIQYKLGTEVALKIKGKPSK
jgi:hypothetical protein